MPTVAIQTPLYRSAQYLPMLLKSLKAQTHTDWKFYALENSGDATERALVKDLLEKSGIPYHFEESATNLGFAGGHNLLMQRHTADFILLLNEDAYLEPKHIELSLARFEADPKAGAVTGIVYRWSTAVEEDQSITDETLVDTTALIYRSLAQVVDRDAGRRWGEVKALLSEPQQIFGVSGAVSMFRRAHVESVAPDRLMFAPFFMYREDVDLALRLRRKGYTSWFDPAILSFHRRSFKTFTSLQERVKDEKSRPASLRIASYRNLGWLMIYHGSFVVGFDDLFSASVQALGLSVLTFLSSPKVFFQAWKELLQGVSAARQRRHDLERLGLPYVRFRA